MCGIVHYNLPWEIKVPNITHKMAEEMIKERNILLVAREWT
jgi:hypothetical protein